MREPVRAGEPLRQGRRANLPMLIGWTRDYETRSDTFSLAAHRGLFDRFSGEKVELTSREAIARFEI